MDCYNCTDVTGNYKADKQVCGRCRKVLKIDLVRTVLSMDRVYLSEANRNNKGRPTDLTATIINDIKYDRSQGMSFGALKKKYNRSKGSISNIIYNK